MIDLFKLLPRLAAGRASGVPPLCSLHSPCRIDFHGSAWLMTGVIDEHTVKSKLSFRRKLWGSIITLFLVVITWLLWQMYTYNNAVRMAKEAGFSWESEDPITLISKDWRNALRKKTWGPHDRTLMMRAVSVSDFDDYREMLQHLRPTSLDLVGREKLQNVDALKDLNTLKYLSLSGCSELKNVDGLKGLTAMEWLILSGCYKIPSAALRELHAALPKTNIVFPDGTTTPPP